MNLPTLAIVCAVAAALAAAIGVVVIAFLLPQFRMPASLREARR